MTVHRFSDTLRGHRPAWIYGLTQGGVSQMMGGHAAGYRAAGGR